MKQYLSTEEYISEVQSHIRWKRARKIATLELADHIEDRKETLIAEGVDKNAALFAAITNMGEPQKIGAELNAVYRPKMNIPLIELTAAFLILGAGISYLSDGMFHINQMSAILMGVFSAVALYLSDYTIMLRHPLTIYFTHVFITAVLLVFEARNGFETIGYSYTFYSVLLFPVSLSAIAVNLQNKPQDFGLFVFTCYVIPPFLAAFLLSSLPAMTIILITYMILVYFGIRNHSFVLSYTENIALACLISAVVIGTWFIFTFFHLRSPFTNTDDNFVRETISDAVQSASLSGNNDFRITYEKKQFLKENYPLVIILNKYGYFGVGCVIALFVGLLAVMIDTACKQKTEIGKMTAGVASFIIAFQLLGSIICNFMYVGSISICIPFLFSGGVFTIIDLILIGIVLSVSRNEYIVREWIRYKEGEN